MKILHILLLTVFTFIGGCAFFGNMDRLTEYREISSRHSLDGISEFVSPVNGLPLENNYPVPDHPYMASTCNSMHCDSYGSETFHTAAPLGRQTEITTRSLGLISGQCPTVNYTSDGFMVAQCFQTNKGRLHIIDPKTHESHDVFMDIAKRGARVPFAFNKMFNHTGGVYLYIDHKDRVVFADAANVLHIIAIRKNQDSHYRSFHQVYRADLSDIVEEDHSGDYIIAVLPDWNNNIWFISKNGMIGYVHLESGRVKRTRIDGEIFQNSFAVAEDGIYVVSDKAIYRFAAWTPWSKPIKLWREKYERGIKRKLGMLELGSGTTPTLFGESYVAIADNDDPINVLVYDRTKLVGDRLICKIPVFDKGKSATENSMIGFNNSLIIENNYGYENVFSMQNGRTTAPGIARIDVHGKNNCEIVWENDGVYAQTVVPKLSPQTGLIYLYTKEPNNTEDHYFLTGVDFRSGEIAFKKYVCSGRDCDNNWSALTLSPDGSACVGLFNGYSCMKETTPTVAHQ